MPQSYEPEFKKKIVRLHMEGRTYKSITAEYGVSKASISKWCAEYAKVFFASPFWTKLQNIFGHCCMSKLDKVAKYRPALNRPV